MMLPWEGLSRPAIIDSRVDFPHPLDPTIHINSPFEIAKLISAIAGISPFGDW